MFSTFRSLVSQLDRLNTHLAALVRLHESVGPAEDRLTALELHRAQFEADMEGLLLKAEGQLKAGRATEARTRNMKKTYEDLDDPFDPDSPEAPAPQPDPIFDGDATAEQTEGMHGMHVGVAPDYKALALRTKFS